MPGRIEVIGVRNIKIVGYCKAGRGGVGIGGNGEETQRLDLAEHVGLEQPCADTDYSFLLAHNTAGPSVSCSCKAQLIRQRCKGSMASGSFPMGHQRTARLSAEHVRPCVLPSRSRARNVQQT